MSLTYEEAIQAWEYCPATGWFLWRADRKRGIKRASRAGAKGSNGYIYLSLKNTAYLAHRVAWLMSYGNWPDYEIDHIDGNPANNKLANLKAATRVENCRNMALRRDNKSGVMGVWWEERRRKWTAYIRVNGRSIHLGRYAEWWDAVCAKKAAEHKHNFHPNHGRR